MRRSDREITDMDEIAFIMEKCDYCNLAFFDSGYPYTVPLNFGYLLGDQEFILYFHSAGAGKKLDLLDRNPHVAFSMNTSHKLLAGEYSCNTSMEYESVCGYGVIRRMEEWEKPAALDCIMDHYEKDRGHVYHEKAVSSAALLELRVREISGKRMRKE